MKHLTIFLVLIFIVISCTNKTSTTSSAPFETRKIVIKDKGFNVLVQDNKLSKILTFPESASSIELLPDIDDQTVFYGYKDTKGKNFNFTDLPQTEVKEIRLTSFYGMYSYNMLQMLKDPDQPQFAKLDPECPFNTKYLIIFILSETSNPVFSCII